MSFVERVTLVKAITTFILVYAMQKIQVQKSICDTIDKCNLGFILGAKAKSSSHQLDGML